MQFFDSLVDTIKGIGSASEIEVTLGWPPEVALTISGKILTAKAKARMQIGHEIMTCFIDRHVLWEQPKNIKRDRTNLLRDCHQNFEQSAQKIIDLDDLVGVDYSQFFSACVPKISRLRGIVEDTETMSEKTKAFNSGIVDLRVQILPLIEAASAFAGARNLAIIDLKNRLSDARLGMTELQIKASRPQVRAAK